MAHAPSGRGRAAAGRATTTVNDYYKFDADVVCVSAGYDHTIRFWEALSGFCSRQIPHPESQINRLCISPNKAYVAAAGTDKVKLYSCKGNDPNPVLVFEGHTANITGIGFHCDGKWMVTSSEDGTVKIWDTKTAGVQRNYNHGSPVNDVVIHPNQGELISCDRGGNIRVWDLGENKCSHQLIPEDDVPVSSVTVATDGGMLCAGNNTGNVYVWRMIQLQDATSLIPVTKFTAHNTYITRVLLSPDSKQLATCSADHTARIWTVPPIDAQTPSALLEPPPEKEKNVEGNRDESEENNGNDDDSEDLDDEDEDDEDDIDDDDSSSLTDGSSPPLSPGTRRHGPPSPHPTRGRQLQSRQPQNRLQQQQQLHPVSQQQHPTLKSELPMRPLRTGSTNAPLDTITSTALQHTHAAHPTTGVPAGPPPPPAAPNGHQTNNKIVTAQDLHNKDPNRRLTAPTGPTPGTRPLNAPNAFPLQTTLHGHQRWVWDCAFSADSAYLVTACSDHYARLWELSTQTVIRQYNGHHRGAVCVALNDFSNM